MAEVPTVTNGAVQTEATGAQTLSGQGSTKPEELPQLKDLPAPKMPAPTSTGLKPGASAATKQGMVLKKPLVPVKTPRFRIESSVDRVRWLKCLFYAEYGVGKTFLSGTSALVPAMNDVMGIQAEKGDLTLMNEEYPQFAAIDSVVVNNFATVARVHEYLQEHVQYRDADNTEKLLEQQELFGITDGRVRKYNTIILDSLTEIDAMCMAATLGESTMAKLDADPMAAEWSDYRANLMKMLRLTRAFRDLPMNVIFICAQQYTQDELKRQKYFPALQGQMAAKVQGFMDLVGYLAVEEGANQAKVRRLYVQPTKRYNAKCRFSMFKGDYFENPTMLSIMQEVGLVEGKPVKTASPPNKASAPLVKPGMKKP